MKRGLTLTAVFLLVGSVAMGQVKAQQGVVARQGPERTSFKSPMILEVPMLVFDEVRKLQVVGKSLSRTQNVPALNDYVCDGVSFQELVLELTSANSKGQEKLVVEGKLFTEKGIDKRVDLTFEMLSKGVPVATTVEKKIDAEEGKRKSVDTKLIFPEALVDPVETPTLRITMQVVANP